MSLFNRHNTLAFSVAIALATTLTACGGGGGGNGNVRPPTPTPTPVPTPTPTPAPTPGPAPSAYNPTQLDPANVTEAWAVGGSPTSNQGQGVKIGILDSGVQATNPALVNRISWFKDYVDPTNTTPQDPYGHGTVIAEIIGGTANADGGEGTYFYGGVAPQSSLYVARIGDASGSLNPGLAPQALSDLAAQGVQLINNSYGVDVAITDPSQGQSLAAERESLYSSVVANKQLMVWAAGNNSNTEPSVEAGLPYYYPALQQNWLTVVNVAINANGQVAGLDPTSNQCGVAAQCLLYAGNRNDVLIRSCRWHLQFRSSGYGSRGASMAAVSIFHSQQRPANPAGNGDQSR